MMPSALMPPGPIGGSFAWRAEAFHDYDSCGRRRADAHADPLRSARPVLRLCADQRFCLMIPFRPGDIQYIHNHVVFHARAAYIDHPPPAPKRHLMRMWLSASDGRELPQALLAKWPVVERGKLRGGAVIAPDHEWIVPLEADTPAY